MPSLGDIRFIDNNPATEGYTQRAGALTSQRAAEVQADRLQADLDQQQRQRAIDQGIDSAMADVVRARTSATAPAPSSPGATVAPLPAAPAQAMPQTPREGTAVPDTLPLAPAPQPQPVAAAPQAAPQPSLAMQAAGRLANVRGGGKQAFTLMQAQQQQQDHWEEMAIKALGTNDLETFRYYQQKSGLQLPPEVLQSAEGRANFARAMDIAKQNYHGDPQQGQVFAQTFMATQGDFQTKLAAAAQKAGPPRDKPNWTATTVYQNGQGVLSFYDSNSRGMPQVQQTGLVNHKPAEPYFSPQPIVREDGSTGLGAFDIHSGKVTDTGQKMGARPTGGMAKNMLVKMGQNSGTLYDATHEGPGQDGEAVITLPADQASRLAVAKGNQMSREKIATITGDYGLAKTELGNEGKATVANINGQWGAAKVDQQGANSLATQKLRNEGALAVAEKRGQAGSAGKQSAWVQQFNQRKAANQGMSNAEIIAQMDTQKQPHERALWAKAVVAADKEADMAGRKINDTPEKLQAAAERTFAVMKKGGAQPAAQPAQPPTAQPAGAASARPETEQVVTQPAPGHNAAKTQKGPDGKDYPVASSEAEYAALPPGSVYFNAVKGKFLTKGK